MIYTEFLVLVGELNADFNGVNIWLGCGNKKCMQNFSEEIFLEKLTWKTEKKVVEQR